MCNVLKIYLIFYKISYDGGELMILGMYFKYRGILLPAQP